MANLQTSLKVAIQLVPDRKTTTRDTAKVLGLFFANNCPEVLAIERATAAGQQFFQKFGAARKASQLPHEKVDCLEFVEGAGGREIAR